MVRRVATLLALALVALMVAAGCGGEEDATGEAGEATNGAATEGGTTEGENGRDLDASFGFDLEPVDESEVSGQVTVTPSGANETHVETVLDNAGGASSYAVNIFPGSCDELGSEPTAELGTAEEGVSDAVLDMGATELLEGDHAVVVSESEENLDAHVACGELPSVDDVIQG